MPTIAIKLLLLFLPISLKFHLVEIDAFLKIPFVVKLNFVFFTFGTSTLNASTADSFNIPLHDKYVTNVIINTTHIANIYTCDTITVLYTGISKYDASVFKKKVPRVNLPTTIPNIDAIKLI